MRVRTISEKIIIAHRGASAYGRENTLEAFTRAIEMGADMIEFDVRRTKDGVFISYHGEILNNKFVKDLTFEEIKEIRADIPAVEKMLQLTKGKIKLDVDLKEEGYEEGITELLLSYFKAEELVITSFNDNSLMTIKNRYPNVETGLILGKEKPKHLLLTRYSEFFPTKRAFKAKADFLVPHRELLRFGFLERVRKAHIPIVVWTVNEEKRVNEFLRNPWIAAIITDKPDLVMSLRKELTGS